MPRRYVPYRGATRIRPQGRSTRSLQGMPMPISKPGKYWARGTLKKPFGTQVMSKVKKSIHQPARPNGTAGWHSKFFYGKRKLPRGYRAVSTALSKDYRVANNAARLTAAVGLQLASTQCRMFNATDCDLILQSIVSGKNQKALFMSCTAEMMITNQDLGNVKVIIYDIIARRDAPTGGSVGDPASAWADSYGDQGATDSNYTIVGTTPFSSLLFTTYFKVLKATHVLMSQGQSHVHRIKFSPNKVLNAEMTQYTTGSFKGLTCFQMIVAYGMPYNDVTTKTQVSTGSVALDVVVRKQYRYTFIDDVTTNYYVVNSLPGAFTVNENIMDIGTGAVEVDTAA